MTTNIFCNLTVWKLVLQFLTLLWILKHNEKHLTIETFKRVTCLTIEYIVTAYLAVFNKILCQNSLEKLKFG